MREHLLRTDCCGCYACYNACPLKCIVMKKNEEGFYYPYVDKEKCIQCRKCENVCPMEMQMENGFEKQVFAAYALDELERKKSSSGAVFPLLAEYVLQKGGFVFGAAFNQEFGVEHQCIDDKSELEILRGTKYVQSQIKDSYRDVKEKLDDGKWVLFTGTPCQVAGLSKYLGKNYENLLTQDIICHGVPAPGVWEDFLKCRIEEKKSEIRSISFRDKEESWENYSLKIEYVNGDVYRKSRRTDLYLLGFLDDIYLRKPCYDCKFKGDNRTSDFTLGDFWGIENIFPDMCDDKGVSVVIVNTPKGKDVLETIQEKLHMKEVDSKTISLYNPSYDTSVSEPNGRKQFYKYYGNKNFDKLVKQVIQEPFFKRVKSYVYNIVRNK